MLSQSLQFIQSICVEYSQLRANVSLQTIKSLIALVGTFTHSTSHFVQTEIHRLLFMRKIRGFIYISFALMRSFFATVGSAIFRENQSFPQLHFRSGQ